MFHVRMFDDPEPQVSACDIVSCKFLERMHAVRFGLLYEMLRNLLRMAAVLQGGCLDHFCSHRDTDMLMKAMQFVQNNIHLGTVRVNAVPNKLKCSKNSSKMRGILVISSCNLPAPWCAQLPVCDNVFSP